MFSQLIGAGAPSPAPRFNTSFISIFFSIAVTTSLIGCGGNSGGNTQADQHSSVLNQSESPKSTTSGVKQSLTPLSFYVVPAGSSVYQTKSAEYAFFNLLNSIRNTMGLNMVTQDALLDQVAGNHSNYLKLNFDRFLVPGHQFGDIDPATNILYAHSQTLGFSGYTGQTPNQRYAFASGVKTTVNVLEVSTMPARLNEQASNAVNGATNFYDLLNTVYHRDVMFQPNLSRGGLSDSNGLFVANYQQASSLANVNRVYFYPSGTIPFVPYFAKGLESPDPLWDAPDGQQAGGIISISADSSLSLKVSSFTVTDPLGNEIKGKTIDASSDKQYGKYLSGNIAYFIPLKPLALATKYTVSFKGILNKDGAMYSVESKGWSFTTPKPEINYFTANQHSMQVTDTEDALVIQTQTPSNATLFSFSCKASKLCTNAFLGQLKANITKNQIVIKLPANTVLTQPEQLVITVADEHFKEVPEKTIYIQLGK